MTTAPSLTDRWARFWYLQRIEFWLDWMPGKRRREVIQELRSNLDAAAADAGIRGAIDDLGTPRALARSYLDQEPARRPHWTQGALAAVAVFACWLYATLFYTLGMLNALESTATDTAATGSFLGTAVLAVFRPGEISAQFDGLPWGPIVAMGVVFVLVSRAWHALPHRSLIDADPVQS